MRSLPVSHTCAVLLLSAGVAMAGENTEMSSPETISPEARAALSRLSVTSVRALGERPAIGPSRESAASVQKAVAARQLKRYPVDIADDAIAGTPVKIFTPRNAPEANSRHILLNLHGGGFTVDSGSLSENIPVAALAGTEVVAVLYPLSPEY